MLTKKEEVYLKQFSKKAEMEVIKMISRLTTGHLGGSLSICDLLSLLYNKHMRVDPGNPKWEDRDWLIFSKGHCGPALYATLALKGYFPMRDLETLNMPHTDLPSHCDRNHTVGVDMTTGSLGQGSSLAAGVATGLKMDGKDNYVYLILGDGEINEGQVWEMAMYASTRKLDHLIAFVDFNRLQLDGRTDDDSICNVGNIVAKFESFGWYAQRVSGHDMDLMDTAIENAKGHKGAPSVIVLDTIKGHGWDKAENQVSSHSRSVSAEELADALAQMQAAYDNIK